MNDLAATEQRPISPEQPIYAVNGWMVFSGICFIYLFFNWYLQTSVLTDEVYYSSLGGRISTDKLAAFLAGQHRMSMLSYLLVPLTLLVKITIVSFCLLTGLLLTSRNLPFAALLKIVLFAESAFATGTLLKLLLLAFSRNINSLGQLENFAPLSLFSFMKASSVPAWLSYPLQTIDIFQVAYLLLLTAGLRFFLKESFRNMLLLVLGSYGLGLLCCMIAFAFLSISFTP
jgi:hypothetical protein